MKKLAIIGSGEFQKPLILKAKELGYDTIVFSKKNDSEGERQANKFFDIDVLDKEKILEICKREQIDGITTIASDITTNAVVYVSEQMNLVGNSLQCLEKATDKYKMRKAFEKNNLKVPKYLLIESSTNIPKAIENLQYPIILKPVDRAGSRGVVKVECKEKLEYAINYAIEESINKKVIAEEYIEGLEYSCECISVNGKHTRLAFTQKFTTGAPNFVETGHIQPAQLNNISNIENTIFKALDALEIKNGASHSEFKITPNNEVVIIEIGARMAGDCIGSNLVKLSTGIDYVKLVIDIALGNKIDEVSINNNSCCGIKFICTSEDYKTFKKTSQSKYIYATSEHILNNDNKDINNSSCRSGWIIVKENNRKTIENILNNKI